MAKVDLPPIESTAQTAVTRDRIMDSAERLLAEHGVANTSVRMITEQANVNVAAVNYHFGTKNKLVGEVIARRFSSLESARAAALDEIEARAAREGRAPTAYELVEALLTPSFAQALSADAGWSNFIRFISRLAWEPGVEDLVPPESALRLLERFDEAFCRAVPALSQDRGKRIWRIAFMRGAAQHALMTIAALRTGRVPKAMQGLAAVAAATDPDVIKRELFAFLAAGLSA